MRERQSAEATGTLVSLDFTTLVAGAILHALKHGVGTQFLRTRLYANECPSSSDGSPYEKRVDAKKRVLSDKCISDEVPFERLPEGWAWARLSMLTANVHYGYTCSSSSSGHIKLLRITDIQNGHVNWNTVPYCASDPKDYSTYFLKEGDILIARTGGTIGKSFFISEKPPVSAFASYLIRAIPIKNEIVPYFRSYFDSPSYWAQLIDASAGTGQPNVNATSIGRLLIALPPLAEQRRIVERVSELMPLVEEYGGLEDAREALDAALPGRLRKSVLQLAVQGGLVPQDPADEPAGVLLERIRGQRRQLVAEGKMRAPKGGESIIFAGSDGRRYEKRVDARGRESEPVCIEDEIPFEIPEGWEWARLSSVLQLSSGLGYKKDSLTVKSECLVRVLRGGNIGEGDEPLVRDSDVMISAEFVDESLLLRDGQIITPAVTSLENVGKAAIVRSADGNTVCGGFVFFLTPFLENPWHSEYLHRYLISPVHIAFCRSVVKKSGQAFYNLSKSSLNLALIAIPPLAEQRRIANEVDRLFKILA